MLSKFLTLGLILLSCAMPVALAQAQSTSNVLKPEFNKNWKTLKTPHFNIHHQAEHKDYAQNVAAIAESVHVRLSAWLGWLPLAPTEVVVLDTFDSSNGFARPFPYNQITLYMKPPVDGELIGKTSWLEILFIHEYIHILQLDMAFAGPQAMRNLFGRSTSLFTLFSFPQLYAPGWVTEGLAVYGESEYSGQHPHTEQFGRLNSAHYDGLMRMEVQRGLYSLTEVSFNSDFRWPYAQIYLYGGYFFKFVETKYGRDAVANYIRVYGHNLIPFRMDKRSKQIFGKPAQQVWAEFQDYLTQRFAPQLAAIKQQNSSATHTVYDTPYSSTALAPTANGDLYFLHDDTSSSPKIRRLGANGGDEFMLDGRGVQELSWHDDSGLLMSKFAVCDNTNLYADLYQWLPGMVSAQRLTHCARNIFAAWRPDGQAIAAIQSEHGNSRLALLDKTGKEIKLLSTLAAGDTLGQIAWAPDGASLAATIQRKKSGWNLELLDMQTLQWRVISATNDLLQRPRFSQDGSEIYFLSDQGKVWNLRRHQLGSDKIDTLSNSASIIAEAVVMPDKSFRMIEYTPYGMAIIAMPATGAASGVSYAATTSSLPVVDAISNAADYQPYAYTELTDYSPWQTLKPQSWFPLLASNTDKTSFVGVTLSGSDALDFHQWSLTPLYYYEQNILGGFANYGFYNSATLLAQRQFLILASPDTTVRFREDEVRYQALLHHSFNTLDSKLYIAAGVASETINQQLISGIGADQKFNNSLAGAIVRFDNRRGYRRSIAAVDGRRVQFLSESYDVLGESNFSGTTSRLDWEEFIGLGGNHALHFRMLYARGDAGIRPYRLGGDSETLSLIGGQTGLGRRDFPLRGYPLGLAALRGSNIGLVSAEWKFPLGYHYDGWFVPPLGIGRQSLALFVDSGDAWNQGAATEFKTGVGIEWNIEALLGYDRLNQTTTLGLARGLDKGGDNQFYLRVNMPFN